MKMLKDFRRLSERLDKTFKSIDYWPEIQFNEFDKEKLKLVSNVLFVNDHSIQLNSGGGNHAILPSQYILYAIYVKELALDVKDFIKTFELKKQNLSANEIGSQIKNKTLDYSDLDLDDFSKKIGPSIFTDPTLNLGAKEIVNGKLGNFTLRGIEDFYGSIILKPINIPNASSSILGKFIYYLTENKEVYDYLEKKFLYKLPYIIKDETMVNFCYQTMSFLNNYDSLENIIDLIVRNDDIKFSSIRDNEINLTSIFRVSNSLLDKNELKQGNRIRGFEDPIFKLNDEYYYFSTEWTNTGNGRLDFQSFVNLIEKHYPEFRLYNENNSYVLINSSHKEIASGAKNGSQIIFFGAPGTGKSFKVDSIIKELNSKFYERLTFHPEFDHASFVGSYKPKTENVNGIDEVKYKFVPQAFTNVYVRAWNDLENQYYLAIEEINRGNCAEIFGDIFQLLDRNSNYTVSPSHELKEHLMNELGKEHEGIVNGLKLPKNLSILATMNTSDQSLFPMDSAFKRRWDWEYIPICYDDIPENESYGYNVIIDSTHSFKWIDFIKNVNIVIKKNTNLGMDKCIGNYFIKSDSKEITLKEFVNKAIFYLWNDVFKDEDNSDSIFEKGTSYEDFFPIETNGKVEILKVLKAINIEPTIV